MAQVDELNGGPNGAGHAAVPPTPVSADRAETLTALATLDGALAALDAAPTLAPDLVAHLQAAREAAALLKRLLGVPTVSQPRLLLADPDVARVDRLLPVLADAGFSVEALAQGDGLSLRARLWRPHLVLAALPVVQAQPSLVAEIKTTCGAAVVVLTGRVAARAAALVAPGVDEYVMDSLPPATLTFKLHSLLKLEDGEAMRLEYGPLRIDRQTQTVTLDGRLVKLTPTEYSLLYHLAAQGGRLIGHEQLLHQVWGEQYTEAKDYLWVHLSRLRRKLALPGQPSLIVTERGHGYRLRIVR